MATLEELYGRTNDSELRNRIEMSLIAKAVTAIDANTTDKAYALTLLDQSTAQRVAQTVLRYLVGKYDIAEPTDIQVDTAVTAVFTKLAGG